MLINQEMKMKILKFVNFFVDEIIEAIQSFYFDRKFIDFDSHIGDTLCQIRAYKNLLLSNNKDNNDTTFQIYTYLEKYKNIKEFIEDKIKVYQSLIDNKCGKYESLLDKPELIESFLNKNSLIFEIPKDLAYLLQNNILSRYSIRGELNSTLGIDHEKLMEKLDCGKTLASKFAKHFQANIAKISCDFIKLLVMDIPEVSYFNRISSYVELIDNNKRNIFPCYEVTKILLMHIQKKRHPVLLIAHRESKNGTDSIPLLFFPSLDGKNFELRQDLFTTISSNACIIIRGTTIYNDLLEPESKFIKRIVQIGLTQLVLCNMAKHPQYSAQEFEFISENPYNSKRMRKNKYTSNRFCRENQDFEHEVEYTEIIEILAEREKELKKMQELASLIGCCKENPTLFFIRHIYCDTLKNATYGALYKTQDFINKIIRKEFVLNSNI